MAEIGTFPKLGEILLSEGLIDEHQLQRSLDEAEQKNLRVGEALVALGFALEEQVYYGLAKQTGVQFFNNEQLLESREDVVRIVPEAFAKENNLIAVYRENG